MERSEAAFLKSLRQFGPQTIQNTGESFARALSLAERGLVDTCRDKPASSVMTVKITDAGRAALDEHLARERAERERISAALSAATPPLSPPAAAAAPKAARKSARRSAPKRQPAMDPCCCVCGELIEQAWLDQGGGRRAHPACLEERAAAVIAEGKDPFLGNPEPAPEPEPSSVTAQVMEQAGYEAGPEPGAYHTPAHRERPSLPGGIKGAPNITQEAALDSATIEFARAARRRGYDVETDGRMDRYKVACAMNEINRGVGSDRPPLSVERLREAITALCGEEAAR